MSRVLWWPSSSYTCLTCPMTRQDTWHQKLRVSRTWSINRSGPCFVIRPRIISVVIIIMMFVFNKMGHTRLQSRPRLSLLSVCPLMHSKGSLSTVLCILSSILSSRYNTIVSQYTISTTYFLWPELTAGISIKLLIFCLRNHYQGYSEGTKIKASYV